MTKVQLLERKEMAKEKIVVTYQDCKDCRYCLNHKTTKYRCVKKDKQFSKKYGYHACPFTAIPLKKKESVLNGKRD